MPQEAKNSIFIRLDSGKFSQVTRHDKGFLTAWGTMSRIGVQDYFKKDGTVTKELRLPEEVFTKESLDSFNCIPVTDEHPRTVITTENAKKFQRGLTGDVTQKKDESYTTNKITITDSDLIKKVEDGKVELSLGYECELDFTPGVHPLYGTYDAIQRNIRGNHLAVVEMARAGHEARLHMDSADNVAIIINKKDETMSKLKIGEKEFETSKEIVDAVTSEFEKLKKPTPPEEKKKAPMNDEEEKKKKDEEAKKKEDPKMDSLLADLQTKYDALEKSIPAKAKEYASVLDTATKLLDADAVKKLDGMDVLEIKKATVKTQCDISEKTDSYIAARFDVMSEELHKEDQKELGTVLAGVTSQKEDSIAELQAKKHVELTQKWKNK